MIFAYIFLSLTLFTLVGKAGLHLARADFGERENLVAPSVGFAIMVYACTSLNLLGLPIQKFALPVALLAAFASFIYLVVAARLRAADFIQSIALPMVVAALVIAFVGHGLLQFGTHWQGLVNEDAATNSLGAQYFLSHGFFDSFDPTSILNGTDYSPIASALYVAAGHRFGDVMFLAFASAVSSLTPDKIYMAHALTLQVAMIGALASLVCSGQFSKRAALFAVTALALSAVANYSFLNQLISQTGGIICLVLVVQLWRVVLDALAENQSLPLRRIALLAIVVAALLRYYPEISTITILAGITATGLRYRQRHLANVRLLAIATFATIGLSIALSNISLPMSLTHLFNSLQSGARALEHIRNSFDYAFTPEVFPLLLGVVRWREALADPWATLSVAASFLLLAVISIKLWKSRYRFSELSAIVFAMTVALSYLFLKREEFGSYKILMLLSPFICVTVAVLVAESISWRRSVFALAGLIVMSANARTSLSYAAAAKNDVNPISFLARGQLLDEFQRVSAVNEGLVIYPQSILLQRFLELRQFTSNTPLGNGVDAASVNQLQNYFLKFGLLFRSENEVAPVASSRVQPSFVETPLSKYFDLIANGLSNSFRQGASAIHLEMSRTAKRVEFACGQQPIRGAEFFLSNRSESASKKRSLLTGGAIQPLNRQNLRSTFFVIPDQSELAQTPLLIQFETSLGGWEVSRDMTIASKSVYFPEIDPSRPGETMSAVGRYMLVEAVGAKGRPQSLRLSYTRSFFGGAKSALPSITIHGAAPYELQQRGSGAIDIVTTPIAPCVIDDRSFYFIDFGVAPAAFESAPPLAYRVLQQRYKPDNRATVGFLRDISIVRSTADPASFVPSWAKLKNGALGGYAGIYEDSWLSQDSRFVLLPAEGVAQATFLVEVDMSLIDQKGGNSNLKVIDQFGKTLQEIPLVSGQHRIKVPFISGNILDVRLVSDASMTLPNDGRKTNGRLISVTTD